MGGGNGSPEIFETWKRLGGGQNAQVVLIPTANNPDDDVAPVVNGLKQLFAVQDVALLDTKDRSKANSDEFTSCSRPMSENSPAAARPTTPIIRTAELPTPCAGPTTTASGLGNWELPPAISPINF